MPFTSRIFSTASKKERALASDIVGGHQSTLLCQLGNIALRSGGTLDIDPTNGHIKNNSGSQKFWQTGVRERLGTDRVTGAYRNCNNHSMNNNYPGR